MNGHQHHLVGTLVVVVNVADEGDIFQIALQRGLLALLVTVVFHVVDQLAQVLQTVCRVLVALGGVRFQHRLVAGDLNHVAGKLVQRLILQRVL